MALALHELGAVPAFDAAHGRSRLRDAGAWLVSSTREGLRGGPRLRQDPDPLAWSAARLPSSRSTCARWWEVVYNGKFPMDFDSVLASQVVLSTHPLGTQNS